MCHDEDEKDDDCSVDPCPELDAASAMGLLQQRQAAREALDDAGRAALQAVLGSPAARRALGQESLRRAAGEDRPVLPPKTAARLVREVLGSPQDDFGHDVCFTPNAMVALQDAAESFLARKISTHQTTTANAVGSGATT